eukprot:TRINITY_DN1060_c0_g2_i1.p1 TRINITY_DN1060_c0_g2~~TRINITY_DN1060_c0_g2_i1.p1  ORF type:complete len:941 (-),score=529.23 TRINITY_DN1060_c0_g2_i1:66-2798(-)
MSKDIKFFNPAKKGEIHELKQDLDSGKPDKQKSALKSVIAAMTVGKDVSVLFPDIVKCIQTPDLELKKLVYLYLMNYAKSQPDLAILAVNTFVTDSTRNPNPLIRALAIRTMGCIRVEKITEYLCQPLHQALKDADPYVRKTAVICVAKLYDISPELVTRQGFLDALLDKLEDINPMVVSNAVAALSEINEQSPEPVLILNANKLNRIIVALDDCTEWGQIYILNCLATYKPRDSREAEGITERVASRLNHNNSAVVLAAIRVLMNFLDYVKSSEVTLLLCRKMSSPLGTLLSREPEIQYVALRNISLILQKRPNALDYDMENFFCKYSDPIYVKMEKLEIMIMLASDKTIDHVLLELKRYATEADVEFVRKAIRAIGRCAIKLQNAAERCIHVLLELIQSDEKYNAVVQEAIVVIKDIFRKYPNRYESIIGQLCENLSSLDEPEAKAAMIWIIGEYADRIENADELLYGFLESFLDESLNVQLQLLTATVKLFLKRPKTSKNMVLNVLNMVTQECDNPDLRDRGFFYWRLLTDPKTARSVVLADKPLIEDDTHLIDQSILDDLVSSLSSVASVYHKPAEAFVSRSKRPIRRAAQEEAPVERDGVIIEDTLPPAALLQIDSTPSPAGTVDLLSGLGLNPSTPSPSYSSSSSSSSSSAFGVAAAPVAAAPPQTSAPAPDLTLEAKVILPADKGDGMQLTAAFALRSGQLYYLLTITNQSSAPISQFVIQFNKNVFGLAPAGTLPANPINPGQSSDFVLPLSYGSLFSPPGSASPFLQIGLKNNIKLYFFQDVLPFRLFFRSTGRFEKKEFLDLWKSLPPTTEVETVINNLRSNDVERVQRHLEANHVFTIAIRKLEDKNVLYSSFVLHDGAVVLLELNFVPTSNDCSATIKTQHSNSTAVVIEVLNALLRA